MAYFLQDQVVPQGRQLSGVPVYWESQSSCVDAFQVNPGSLEWKLCEEKFTSFMPVVVKQITRIQNLWQWEACQFIKINVE